MIPPPDRVMCEWYGGGTGDVVLGAKVRSHRHFVGVVPVGERLPVVIEDTEEDYFEVGYCLHVSEGVLTRQQPPLSSSAGGAAVNFPAGTKKLVYAAEPADMVQYRHRHHGERFELTFLEVAQKRVFLAAVPAPGTVQFSISGGPVQVQDIGFIVTGQEVSWASSALGSKLSVGDVINISYASAVP